MLSVHKKWRAEHKKKEALWKRSISLSHQVFCSCPSYLNHFQPPVCRSTAVIGEDVSPAEGLSFVTEDGGEGPGGEGGDEDFVVIKQ
nr:MAG: ORF2 [Torque teno polar bear virus 21]